jgi:4-amino-4-deoxy-L-arabinose transferase-like glycosyltransferase
VDAPPGVALVAWASRYALGDSLLAIRFVPILCASFQVLLAGLTARAMGGKLYAQIFTALCVMAAPIYFGSYLNTDMFMNLGWVACVWVAVRIFAGGSPKLWLLLGLFAGLAFQGKHAILIFGCSFAVGLLLSPQRKTFLDPWAWAGGLLALLIALPNLIWEYAHHWPTYELLSNIAKSNKNVVLGPGSYLLSNILLLSPITFPVWSAGLLWCLFAKSGRPFRALGWTWVVAYLIFALLHGKSYYLAPCIPRSLRQVRSRLNRGWKGCRVSDWSHCCDLLPARWCWPAPLYSGRLPCP